MMLQNLHRDSTLLLIKLQLLLIIMVWEHPVNLTQWTWGFIVYPNPAADVLNIEIDDDAAKSRTERFELEFRLYDGQGNMLRQSAAKGGSVQINLSGLPDGIYYLHVYDGTNNAPEIRQIMIER